MLFQLLVLVNQLLLTSVFMKVIYTFFVYTTSQVYVLDTSSCCYYSYFRPHHSTSWMWLIATV